MASNRLLRPYRTHRSGVRALRPTSMGHPSGEQASIKPPQASRTFAAQRKQHTMSPH